MEKIIYKENINKISKIYLRFITFNRWNSIKKILLDINNLDNRYFQIQIFDNSTNENILKVCQKFPNVEYIKTGENIGFQNNYIAALTYDLEKISSENNYICILADDDKGHKKFLSQLRDVIKNEILLPSWFQLSIANSQIDNLEKKIIGKNNVVSFYKKLIENRYIPCSLISDCIFNAKFLIDFLTKNKIYEKDTINNNNFPQTLLISKILDFSHDISIIFLDFNLEWVPQKKSGFSMFNAFISLEWIYKNSEELQGKETNYFLNWVSLSFCSWIVRNKFKKFFRREYYQTNDSLFEAIKLFKISTRQGGYNYYPLKYFILLICLFFSYFLRIK